MEQKLRMRNPAQRKPYLAPKLTEVELRPEEAVLGICKLSESSGPIQADCTTPVVCSDTGS
jgi:hypothetical protein